MTAGRRSGREGVPGGLGMRSRELGQIETVSNQVPNIEPDVRQTFGRGTNRQMSGDPEPTGTPRSPKSCSESRSPRRSSSIL